MLASSGVFVPFFCIIVFGYLVQSYVLLLLFYVWRRVDVQRWKSQPAKANTVGVIWAPPLLSSKPLRLSSQGALCSFNLIMAGVFAGAVAEAIQAGQSRLLFVGWFSLTVVDWLRITIELVVLLGYESIVEYWWHRAMHTNYLYSTFHKIHHSNKAPEPFDDMMIHPLEAFGYYCILYSPPFLFPTTLNAFVLYMVVCGLCGVFDHSGVRLSLAGIYDSHDHDLHHSKTNINFGFPFSFTDRLFGTYYSES
jgi:sterol desaturase/sphingolipid hydroxylase (fatty acid hydroxylase superfamily)